MVVVESGLSWKTVMDRVVANAAAVAVAAAGFDDDDDYVVVVVVALVAAVVGAGRVQNRDCDCALLCY